MVFVTRPFVAGEAIKVKIRCKEKPSLQQGIKRNEGTSMTDIILLYSIILFLPPRPPH